MHHHHHQYILICTLPILQIKAALFDAFCRCLRVLAALCNIDIGAAKNNNRPAMASFSKLPLETIHHIACLARDSDLAERPLGRLAKKDRSDHPAASEVEVETGRGAAALSLAKTCRTVADVALPVVWRVNCCPFANAYP